MPTEAELKTQHDALSTTLKGMQEQNAVHAGQIAEVMGTLKTIQQTQEALNRGHQESQLGPQGESRYYCDSVSKEEKAFAPQHYVETAAGSLRLRGHDVQAQDGSVYHVPGLLDDVEARDDAQARLQRAVSDMVVTKALLRSLGRKSANDHVHAPNAEARVRRAIAGMPEGIRKIFSDFTGLGLEAMPYVRDAAFERDLLASHSLGNMISQVAHPGGTVEPVFVEGTLQAFIDAIPSTDDPANSPLSSLGTPGNDTIKCIDIAVGSQLHRSAQEQSIVAMLPLLRLEMARAHGFADENALVNGQTGAAFDTIAGWDVRGRMGVTTDTVANQLRACDGFRSHARTDGKTLDMGAKQTFEGAMELVGLLGIESLMESDGGKRVIIGVSPEFFFGTMYKWAEFKTWDSVGAIASILSGTIGGTGPVSLPNQVGYLFGRFPVVLIFGLTPDLNDLGVHSAVALDNVKTGMVAVDLARYQRWTRNGVVVESAVDIGNNTIRLVSRQGRKIRRTKSTQASAAFGYNLTSL